MGKPQPGAGPVNAPTKRPTKRRYWVVQLSRTTIDGVKQETPPEEIATDLADPEAVGDVLLTGYINEFAGEKLGLDYLHAWVWEPGDHAAGKPPLVTVGGPANRFTWGEIADRRGLDAPELVERARALHPQHLLADGTGVTADGYTLLLQLPPAYDDRLPADVPDWWDDDPDGDG